VSRRGAAVLALLSVSRRLVATIDELDGRSYFVIYQR